MEATITKLGIREIPLEEILVVTNPRKRFDEEALADLARSIAEDGLLQAILVRVITDEDHEQWAAAAQLDSAEAAAVREGQQYELVAGERRLRAHRLNGAETIRADVREISRAKAAELRLVENLQREDLHELEEAAAFRDLMESDGYAVDDVAELCGKSTSYVYQRLKLLELVPDAQSAFFEETITAGHAILIARLTPELQAEALEAAVKFGPWVGGEQGGLSVRGLQRWIEHNVHLDLHAAPFKMDDAELVPEAGPCTTCPKRTGFTPDLFPDVEKGETCTDRACYHGKLDALVERRLEELTEAGDPFVAVVWTHWIDDGDRKRLKKRTGQTVHTRGEAHEVSSKKDRCEHVGRALIVAGGRRGELLDVCVEKACPKHAGRYQSPPKTKAEKRRQRWQKERGERRTALARELERELAGAVSWPLRVDDVRLLAALTRDSVWSQAAKEVAKHYGWEEHREAFEEGLEGLTAGQLAETILRLLLADMNAHGGGRIVELAKMRGVDIPDVERRLASAAKVRLPEDVLPPETELVRWGPAPEYFDDRTRHVSAHYAGGPNATICGHDIPDDADVERLRDVEPHRLTHICGNCERGLVGLVETSADAEAA